VRQLIAALDAPSLPLFFEFGSIVFFASACPHRRKVILLSTVAPAPDANVHLSQTVAPAEPARLTKVFSQREALADFRTVKESGSRGLRFFTG